MTMVDIRSCMLLDPGRSPPVILVRLLDGTLCGDVADQIQLLGP